MTKNSAEQLADLILRDVADLKRNIVKGQLVELIQSYTGTLKAVEELPPHAFLERRLRRPKTEDEKALDLVQSGIEDTNEHSSKGH